MVWCLGLTIAWLWRWNFFLFYDISGMENRIEEEGGWPTQLEAGEILKLDPRQ